MKTVRRGTSLNIDYLNTEFHTSVRRYREIEVIKTKVSKDEMTRKKIKLAEPISKPVKRPFGLFTFAVN